MSLDISRHFMCPEYSIGTSVNGLWRLDYLNIPFPIRTPFVPYSVRNVGGNKLVTGDGFPSCSWIWEPALDRGPLSRLLEFIGAGLFSAYVYIRTTDNTNYRFNNYLAVMAVPQELTPVGHNVGAFDAVTVAFTALVQQ